jgi:hypothetical protein
MTIIRFRSAAKQRDLFTKRWRKIENHSKEISLHIQLVSMLRWCIRPDVIFRHVPNGEQRDPRTAAKLKAMGILPGSADLEFHWAEMDTEWPDRKCRRMLHLELKVGNRQRTESQIAFDLVMRLLGDEYHIARTVNQAIEILGTRGLLRHDVEVCGRRW